MVVEKMSFDHERRSLQLSWVWLREREGARGLRERKREGFGTEMRGFCLVRDKIVF